MANENEKNPRDKFYNDKFPKQDQDTPALQSEMIPEPDTGEESYKSYDRLQERNALITGGDSGIGRAAAVAFAKEGANVAIQFYPGEEKDANQVKEFIESQGRKALLLPYDLRDDGAATEIVEKTAEAFGGLDILVLNAAQQIAAEKMSERSMKQIEDTFKVNVISMFESVKAAEKYLKEGSAIITTTSVQSFDPSEHLMEYAATKGAITNFTISLASYFAPKGIRVNGVAPGPIWTPLQLDEGQPQEAIPKFGQDTPLGRAGQPVELAPVYVLLASDEASYITGQIYGVTGGEPIN